MVATLSTGGAVAGSAPAGAATVGGGGAAASAALAIVNGELNLVVGNPVNTNPTNITVSVSGTTLNLSWPADHTRRRLLAQTNNLNRGVSGNTNDWRTCASGYASMNAVSIPIVKTYTNEYYRLVYH